MGVDMALRDIFKISWKTFVNPIGWLDYDALKRENQLIYRIIKPTMTIDKPTQQETFEEAQERLGLSEADIEAGQHRYRRYALLFALCGLLVFYYAFYLVFRYLSFPGFLLGIAVSMLFFAYAFKFDFWSLQMRRRKLGLTFADWKLSYLSNEKVKHD